MAEPTLVAAGLFSVVVGLVYLHVGRLVGVREVSSEAALASRLFAAWWQSLAGLSFVGAAFTLAASAGYTSLALHTLLTYVALGVLCIALWALVYYLLFLFTGWRSIFWPLSAFYAAYFVVLTYFVTAARPVAVIAERWRVRLEYASDASGAVTAILVFLLLLPQIVGALAYFTLYFRLRDPAQKYRVALVSWSLIVWFGSGLVASQGGWSQEDWWQATSRLIGLAAALAVVAAYRPPRWVQRRLRKTPASGGGA